MPKVAIYIKAFQNVMPHTCSHLPIGWSEILICDLSSFNVLGCALPIGFVNALLSAYAGPVEQPLIAFVSTKTDSMINMLVRGQTPLLMDELHYCCVVLRARRKRKLGLRFHTRQHSHFNLVPTVEIPIIISSLLTDFTS
jgi:hypothetical protein